MIPIGVFRANSKFPYDVPRQGSLNQSAEVGVIELQSGLGYEQALEDLEGFDRIWLIYEFHQNENWNPKTVPPRGPHVKRGVFATRSPYRPNPLGLSCVKLLKVEGLKVYVHEFDLLDQTPVLDIKPYIPYADSFPDAKIGWLEGLDHEPYTIQFSETAAKKIKWLSENGVSALQPAIVTQLQFEPIDHKRKRVERVDDHFVLSYRTWRIHFSVRSDLKELLVSDITSGYSLNELSDESDIYSDKTTHRKFMNWTSAQGG